MRIPSIAIVATLALLVGACSMAMGQSVGGSGTVKKHEPASGGDPAPRSKAPVRVVTRTVEKKVTPTTGSLSVAAESSATILVEPINIRNGQGQKGVVPANERIFIFNDLKPGRYRVAGTLAGHNDVEATVDVAANKSQSATLNFQRILYSVTINTNVNTGELKYGEENQPVNQVAQIQNQKVQLRLPAGKYVVEITPGEFGYDTLHDGFSLTQDQTFAFALKRIILSKETLSPTWTSAELQGWDMPPGWHADAKRNLWVKGPGVGLPREARNRYYKDFRLESNVKMTNGVAASFALRARDSQNYYLLQLTGGNADEPYVVRLLAVKNGVPQRLRAIPISRSSAGAMASGQFFTVSIKMIDYEITVDIVDSQTGAPYTLGVLTDPDHNFAVGAVGIAARQNEENVIERFIVCTDKCLKE
jgi:hypothetical protein